MQTYDCGPVRPHEYSFREGTMRLFEQNPDLNYYSQLFPEPDVNMMGPGLLGMDAAGYRLMPNKHILFAVGVPDEKYIPSAWDPKTCQLHTSAGTPLGASWMMKHVLEKLGYTYEIVFFDSNLTYHHDCLMMNMKEGVCGLPDDGKWGHWGGLPNCLKDWEIVAIPPHEIGYGVANAAAIGDGRVICEAKATGTHENMYKAGIDPIPLPYDKLWDAYGSGMECSDDPISRWDDGNEPPSVEGMQPFTAH